MWLGLVSILISHEGVCGLGDQGVLLLLPVPRLRARCHSHWWVPMQPLHHVYGEVRGVVPDSRPEPPVVPSDGTPDGWVVPAGGTHLALDSGLVPVEVDRVPHLPSSVPREGGGLAPVPLPVLADKGALGNASGLLQMEVLTQLISAVIAGVAPIARAAFSGQRPEGNTASGVGGMLVPPPVLQNRRRCCILALGGIVWWP